MTKVAHVNVAATIFFSKFKTKIKVQNIESVLFLFLFLVFLVALVELDVFEIRSITSKLLHLIVWKIRD